MQKRLRDPKELHGVYYTYQSSHSFLQGIAETLLNAADASQDPFYLSSYTLLVPTARVKRTLTQTFLHLQKEKGRVALFLPTFFTLGEIPTRPADFLRAVYQNLPYTKTFFDTIPQSLSSKELLFLCWKAAQKASTSLEEGLALAQSLCDFLDLLQSEGKSLEGISLSLHGKSTLYEEKCLLFWSIFKEIWAPLKENIQALPPSQYKEYVFSTLAHILDTHKTDRPVLILGPQGLFPGSKSFLKSILSLPKGSLVLDPVTSFSLEAYQKKPASFPEFWLYEQRHLLEFLNISSFIPWPVKKASSQPPVPLSLFIRGLQGSFKESIPALPSSSSVLLFEGENLFEQARYIALKMREVLTHPTKTAALITSSRTLTQAVREELTRWNILVDDSLGIPLSQTKAGSLLLLLSSFWKNPFCPLTLLSLLKHPCALLFSGQASYQKSLLTLEKQALRGIAPKSFKDLKDRIALYPALDEDDHLDVLSFLDTCEKSLNPLFTLSSTEKVPFASALSILRDVFLAITSSSCSEDMKETLSFLETLLSQSIHAPSLLPSQIPFLLKTFLIEQPYYTETYDHPRLSIWGCAESRLLERDVFILGDLNEGYWPKSAPSNPWITSELLETFGLSPYKKEKGELAHDFAHGLLASEVILTYRKKDTKNLLDPSCFLLYLKQAFEAAGIPLSQDTQGAALVQKLSLTHKPLSSFPCPAPTPPLHSRPRDLSISDIDLLRKDPYGFYAKKILRLIPSTPLLYEPGAQDFGNLLHHYLEFYAQSGSSRSVDSILTSLEQDPLFLALSPFKQEVWKKRFQNAFLFFEEAHKNRLREGIEKILYEHTLSYSFDLSPALIFTLRGRADRVEITAHHHTIGDYKSGILPSFSTIKEGYAPQLPLLGLLVKNAPDVPNDSSIDLWYWHFGKVPSLVALSNPSHLIEEAQIGLHHLLSLYYLNAQKGFTATFSPHSPYTHLKRTKEWAGPLSIFQSTFEEEG